METFNKIEKERYWFLDGLRGISAISIYLYHKFWSNGVGFLANAWLAVDFFFLLSGFIVANSYEERLKKGMSATNFMQIRLIRLYPMYFLSIILGLFLTVKGYTPYPLSEYFIPYICHIFMIPTHEIFQATKSEVALFPINVVAWSLALEIFINFIYAVIAKKMSSKLLITINIISLISVVSAVLYYQDASLGWKTDGWQVGFTRVFWEFFFGVSIYRLTSISRKFYFPIIFVYIITVIIIAYIIFSFHIAGLLFLNMFNIIIVFPFILYISSMIESNNIISKLYRILGEISYPLYITHIISMGFSLMLINSFSLNPESYFIQALMLLLPIFMAWLLYKKYDLPIRKYLTRKFIK